LSYIGKNPVSGNFVKLDAITTSATATYNLLNGGVAYFPQTANNCIVSLNGVIQSPTSAYTISGSTIVFSDALTASDSIDFILVLGDVLNIGTPSDATVGFAKVTSNLITGATAETSIDGADSVLIYDDSATALRKMTRTNFFTAQPSFSAYQSSAQTLSSGVATKINFQTEEFDTNSNFDSTTNYRFTPTVAGYYYFTGNIAVASSATSVLIDFYKNGSSATSKRTNYIVASAGNTVNGSALISLNGTTDYVEMFAFFGTGQAVTADSRMTYFQGFFVRTL
jgi:hypothetical protein